MKQSFYSEVCPKHHTVVNLVTNPLKNSNYCTHKLLYYSKSVFCVQSVCYVYLFISCKIGVQPFSCCRGKKKCHGKISLMLKTKPFFPFCYGVKNVDYNRNPIQLEVLELFIHSNIQDVSRLQDITAGGDFLGLCDEKSSY